MPQQVLKLAYLYPKLLNIYGDQGNVLSLSQRCSWRGIELIVDHVDIGEHDKKFADYDLFFIGGGQDRQQEWVAEDLELRKNEFKEAAEKNAVVLSICGGYQMLGDYYQTGTGTRVEGLKILDVYTEAPKEEKTDDPGLVAKNKIPRCIGNVVAKLNPLALSKNNPWSASANFNTLVGFENHSGRTYITSDRTMPLAFIEKGFGNNGTDKTEGAIYKNIFGTYMHGSLLPKNPQLADELILRALRRSNPEATLSPLEDTIEKSAHQAALSLR